MTRGNGQVWHRGENPSSKPRRLWSIVLAGGEGERTRAFIEGWLGYHKPKQYCTFVGTRSLLQHTMDRADALSRPEQRVVIAAARHRPFLPDQMRGREKGLLLFQPSNRGTAAGVFLGLTYILAKDPDAIVVVYPADHFIHPEGVFLDTVRQAVRVCEGIDEAVLLGVRPSAVDSDFGWIVPASGWPTCQGVWPVKRFAEKPTQAMAARARAQGGLWNTFIVASKLKTLWSLGWRHVPDIMPYFVELRDALRESQDRVCLEQIYRNLPSRDFSAHVLQRAARQLAVLEMKDVYWSDWGRPERILETLCGMGTRPSFSEHLALSAPRANNVSPLERSSQNDGSSQGRSPLLAGEAGHPEEREIPEDEGFPGTEAGGADSEARL